MFGTTTPAAPVKTPLSVIVIVVFFSMSMLNPAASCSVFPVMTNAIASVPPVTAMTPVPVTLAICS